MVNLVFCCMILLLDYNQGWNWESLTYSDFWTPAGFVRNLFFNGWHPVFPWVGFLFYGIMLSRMSLCQVGDTAQSDDRRLPPCRPLPRPSAPS